MSPRVRAGPLSRLAGGVSIPPRSPEAVAGRTNGGIMGWRGSTAPSNGHRIKSWVPACFSVAGLVAALAAGVAAPAASAAPANAPSSLTGTFDCGNGVTGVFVVNSGNAQSANTWNVAHLTFSSGGTGIFVPTMLDLTFSAGGQSFTSQATKGSAPSAITCSIAAGGNGFSLSGVVVGRIVRTS